MEDLFKTQISKPLSILREKLSNDQMDYFYKVWNDFWDQRSHPEKLTIAITDVGLPEIYIRASGANPWYLFGGNYFTDKYTEEIFPQISDPVVKSVCSMLFSGQLSNASLAAVVMPIRNASARKALSYLLDAGFKVIPVEEEPFLSEHASKQFVSGQLDFLLELQKITNCRITPQKLYIAARQITEAHKVLQKLDETNLPVLVKSFVQQTYYMATNLEKWIEEVKILSDCNKTTQKNPADLLLTGSPIYFPNSKVPLILQSLGITEYQNHCGAPRPISYENVLNSGRKGKSFFELLHEHHYQDVRTDITHTFHVQAINYKTCSGVIYYLLKGQLMYAYEAEQAEKICIRDGIPFVCVETDYTDADTEQIKIRLEAFSELLFQSSKPKTKARP